MHPFNAKSVTLEKVEVVHNDRVLNLTLKSTDGVSFVVGMPVSSTPRSLHSPPLPLVRIPASHAAQSYNASLESGVGSDENENEGTDVPQRHSQTPFLAWDQDFSQWKVLQEGAVKEALLVSDYVEGLPWKTGRTTSFSRSNCGPSGWIWSLVGEKEVDEWTMDYPAVDASKRCRYWKSFWFPRILVSKLSTLSFHSVTHVLQV